MLYCNDIFNNLIKKALVYIYSNTIARLIMVRIAWYDTIMTDFSGRLPDISIIEAIILNIEDDLTRIFCILSYLTGGRISEIVNYCQEIYIKKAKRDKNKKTIKDAAGNTVYEWIKREQKTLTKHKGLMKKNILREKIKIKDLNNEEKEIDVLTITMRNEKNKKKSFKTIYSPYHFENNLIDTLFTYLQNLNDDEVIINIDRRKMYANFRKYAGKLYYPHFIRALRVGVLLEIYEFEEYQVKEFMGWTDNRPLESYYIFKKDHTMLKKFLTKIKES